MVASFMDWCARTVACLGGWMFISRMNATREAGQQHLKLITEVTWLLIDHNQCILTAAVTMMAWFSKDVRLQRGAVEEN